MEARLINAEVRGRLQLLAVLMALIVAIEMDPAKLDMTSRDHPHVVADESNE